MKDRNRSKKSLFQISKVLWHLDIFRRSFRELNGHTCMVESCIFCALKELFSQLQLSHESALPPDALRKALAQSFFDQQRFHLGFMDDAAECFETILIRIHYHLTGVESEDLCSTKHCVPHVKFAMTLVEQSVCGACGATSEPLPFTQMVHYVSASALISQAKQPTGSPDEDLFGQLLKKAGGMGDIRDCPSLCGAKIQIRRTLTNFPEVVSVGIVWDSERPSLQQVTSLLDVLRTSVRLSHVFHTPAPSTASHDLVALVTYYGKHYATFFFHTKLRTWIYFDDANVREVGPNWEQVVEKCCRGRYQPLLLLYATADGTPVDTTNAPTKVTICNAGPATSGMNGSMVQMNLGMMNKIAVPQQTLPGPGPARRSLTPSPEKPCLSSQMQRRALTPNPDQNSQRSLGIGDYQNLSIFQGEVQNGRGGWRTDLVRRDSGNWSGDRNSASSSSSTSLENPYQYIISRMQHRTSALMRSPSSSGKGNGGESSSGGSQCDGGYDSYSLSSTDSLPLQQSLKHNLQLAKIPEGHHSPIGIGVKGPVKTLEHADCEKLCEEADLLLYHSQATDDLQTALSFANAAVEKARQAMDAPYSNPGAASAARMKHNACLMQARSIYKKIEDSNGTRHAEGRHSREGSSSSNRGSHSRQSSKDKGNHSRQNSKELLTNLSTEKTSEPAPQPAEKNIEIYATLPKTRKGLLSRATKVKNVVEDEEYLLYDRPGRSLGRNKPQTGKKEEKRARSEDRSNKAQKEVISNQLAKEAKKQAKTEEAKQGKKQHKIRRKLLMGGLIKRKNRSLPDLRDDEVVTKGASKDDSSVGKTDKQTSLSGYLSEGHLEYSGNPNLEKSKLMRKSFHGSKLMQLAKVPPPPPVRTSSQLTKFDRLPFPIPVDDYKHYDTAHWSQEPQSLPPMNHYSDDPTGTVVNYAVGGYLLQQNCNTKLVTTAQVHQVSSPVMHEEDDEFQLPPYPSPLGSVSHSRQASEDFPPPPPEEQPVNSTSLLEQLQKKRLQILCDSSSSHYRSKDALDSPDMKESLGGDTWLKELQAKQASLREKNTSELDRISSLDVTSSNLGIETNSRSNDSSQLPEESSSSVKDLKSRFEKISVKGIDKPLKISNESSHKALSTAIPIPVVNNVLKPENLDSITPAPLKELKSNLVKPSENRNGLMNGLDDPSKRQKKKSVTFCEQVVLVATAEEDKVDSFIPNPILERVLRSVLHKDSPQEVREVTVQSVVPLKRNDSGNYGQCGKRNQETKSSTSEEIKNSDALIHHPISNDTSAINKAAVPFRAQPSPVLSRQPMRLQPSPMNIPLTPANGHMPSNSMMPVQDHRVTPLPTPYQNGIDNNSLIQRNQNYLPQDSIHNGNGYSPLPMEGNMSDNINHHSMNGTSEQLYTRYKTQNNDQLMTGNAAPNINQNQSYARPPLPPNNLNNNGALPQSSSYPYTAANLAALHSQIQNHTSNGPVYHHVNGIKQNIPQTGLPLNQNAHIQSVQNQNGVLPNPSSVISPNNVGLSQHTNNSENQVNPGIPYGSRASPQNYIQRPPSSSGSPASCYQSPPVSLPYSQQMMQQAMLQRQYSGQVSSPTSPSPLHQPRIVQSSQAPNPHSLRQRVGSPNHFSQGQLTYIQKPQYAEAPKNNDLQHVTAAPAQPIQVPYQHYNGTVINGESNAHLQQSPGNGSPVGHNVSISRSLSNSSQHSSQSSGSSIHYNSHTPPDQQKQLYSPYMTPPVAPSTANRSCYMPVPQKKAPEEARRARPQGVYQQDPDNTPLQRPDIYQRVPNPEHYQQTSVQYSPYLTPPQPANYQPKYSPYQHPPMPKQDPTKPSPPSSAPLRTAACNLCRKKQVIPPTAYCPDCDFYMSRFKPKA